MMDFQTAFLQELIEQKTISVVVDSHLSHGMAQAIVTGKRKARKIRRLPREDDHQEHHDDGDRDDVGSEAELSLNEIKEIISQFPPAKSRWEGSFTSSSDEGSTSSTSLESSFSDNEEDLPSNPRCPTIEQIQLPAIPTKKVSSSSKKRFFLPWHKKAKTLLKSDSAKRHNVATKRQDRTPAQPTSSFLKSIDRPSAPTISKPWEEARRGSDKPPKITFRRSSAEINSETA